MPRSRGQRRLVVGDLTLLIAPKGDWVFPDSPEFYEALGDPDPDYDAVAFAVKNLGFIKFQTVGQAIVEIELHPRNVELPALLAVQQQLVLSPVKLFRIKYLEMEWRSEISSSTDRVISRLSELCAPQFATPASDRFSVEPVDFSAVFDDEENWLRPLAQKWRTAFGQFDPSVVSLAVSHGLLSRLVIVGVKPRVPEPLWRFIGEGHKWMGNAYRLRGVGEQVENMPDKDYGGWVTNFYKSVASSGVPRYDLVTGTIQYEDEHGKPRRPHRYERLMLPWKTPSDEVFVTMCSRPVTTAGDSRSSDSISPPVSRKLLSSS
jgi:hypothetical protein